MNKKLLASTIAVAFTAIGATSTASAALTNGSTLNFDAGVTECFATSSYGACLASGVKTGSYFGMDTNGNGAIVATERTAISQDAGLVVGTAQAAGAGGIDNVWSFFGNAGQHYSATATNVISAAGNTASLDFSGWTVAWNGIPSIPMGAGASNGVASVVCGVDCGDGDTFTLDYAATVPTGDPSGFGDVSYALRLTGTVSAVPVPAAVWLFGSGLVGLAGIARRRKAA